MRLAPNEAASGWERALDLADRALYAAKKRGRNRAFGVAEPEPLRAAGRDAADTGVERTWQDGIEGVSELLGTTAGSPPPAWRLQ